MITGTIVLSTFFGTVGGLVYDAIYEKGETGVTKTVYKSIYDAMIAIPPNVYKGTKTIFTDVYEGTKTILSDVYKNSPSKEAIGSFISTPAEAAWTAGKAVVGDIYQNSPSKEAIGNFISTPAEAAWGGISEVVSKTYEGVKMTCIDIYGGAKYGLYDIFGEQSNLNGLGTGAITASILSICGAPTTPLLLISFGAATFTKSVTKCYTDRTSSLFNKDLVSSFNTFFNKFDDNKKSIFEEYKKEVFSFNTTNKVAFQKNKEILAKKYLEEIDEYVEDFQADSATGFCDLKKEMAIYYTILHYTRKADTLNEDDDVMLSSSDKKDHPGYEFYQKHYERQEIVQDFKSICALRKSIDEFAKENSIQEGEYQEFCQSHQNDVLCSDFVKDVMFPELVDA